jgi:hypothetical protein
MIMMYEEKKEVMVYAAKEHIIFEENEGSRECDNMSESLENAENMNYEEGSD